MQRKLTYILQNLALHMQLQIVYLVTENILLAHGFSATERTIITHSN